MFKNKNRILGPSSAFSLPSLIGLLMALSSIGIPAFNMVGISTTGNLPEESVLAQVSEAQHNFMIANSDQSTNYAENIDELKKDGFLPEDFDEKVTILTEDASYEAFLESEKGYLKVSNSNSIPMDVSQAP